MELDDEQRAMLDEARTKARRLVAELEKQQKELDAAPPKHLDQEKLALGRQAMANALAAARRSLSALDDAHRIADSPES